jgi:hypothetical protein
MVDASLQPSSADRPPTLSGIDRPRYAVAGTWRAYDFGAILARLGRASDAALAREIGCPRRDDVRRLRVALGIPAHDRGACLDAHLGRVPDARLARHFKLSRNTVAARRRRKGMPPANRRRANADRKLRYYVVTLKKELRS